MDERGSAARTMSCNDLVRGLIERGLITADARSGKSAATARLKEPSLEVTGDDSPGALDLAMSLEFLRAFGFAWTALRLSSIERIVQRVRRRNAGNGHSTPEFDLSALKSYIAAFVRLRPFVFTSHDACLLECLVLSEFLARKGVHPNWVFAVQFEPFAAHCWLQLGSIVLNDSVERVSHFNPIMIV